MYTFNVPLSTAIQKKALLISSRHASGQHTE